MESIRLYPIGIQDFEKIRRKGYIYVDKTALIYKMIKTGNYYFLSRPRRFGKSLLLSTIEAYFLGKKELFNGLAMEKLEKDWNVHPVLHLDLNPGKYSEKDDLKKVLEESLIRWENLYGSSVAEQTQTLRFKGIIDRAYEKTGQRVVILIDEYDKPLLQSIGNDALQIEYRGMLKAFYGVLKTMDRAIQFALLTGVTKFGKVSIFSDLNNLNDLSLASDFTTICGITEEEIDKYFKEDIEILARANDTTYEESKMQLKKRYDGYHFSRRIIDLYNPFSLLNTFFHKEFRDYWFETGTPEYLTTIVKNSDYNLNKLANEEITSSIISSIDSLSDNPIPILYQSGYLTIKNYESEFGLYKLGFPNEEVINGFLNALIPIYTPIKENDSTFEIGKFVNEIRNGEIDKFFHRLNSFFTGYPYEMIRDLEIHYQNVLYIVFKLVGLYTQVEYHTSSGRIDLILSTKKYIYVMEFKLNGSAKEALEQINRKHYTSSFENEEKKVFKIGVNFSSETKSIDRWIVEGTN